MQKISDFGRCYQQELNQLVAKLESQKYQCTVSGKRLVIISETTRLVFYMTHGYNPQISHLHALGLNTTVSTAAHPKLP